MPTEAWHAFKSRQKNLLGDLTSHLLIKQMAPTITDDGILIVLDQDTHGYGAVPLSYVMPNGCLAPI